MLVYIIMPVGADKKFNEKRFIIESISQQKGIITHFPFDKNKGTYIDINATLTILSSADFVLADLSLERPSCYFELGLAQAIGKTTFIIAEQDTDIHQANDRNLTRFYTDLEDYKIVISKVLAKAKKL